MIGTNLATRPFYNERIIRACITALGVLVAVTGVAGSGKSSLIHGCLTCNKQNVPGALAAGIKAD